MNYKIWFCYFRIKNHLMVITALMILSCFFVSLISAAAPQDKDPEMTKSEVDANMMSVRDLVTSNQKEDGKSKIVDATFIDGFIQMIDFIGNYPRIEAITGVSREWYKDLVKKLKEMREPRARMDAAIMNNDGKAYLAAEVEYEANRKKLIELMDHPKKATGRK